MTISLPLLEAFIALEESRHFTQAAERCHLTQSAFSQAIRRLESAVGARLFDRDTRSVRLTPEGAVFAVRARRIRQEIHLALTEMQDYARGKQGRLALAIIPSLAASWLPPILDEYARTYPGIVIEVFDTHPDRGMELLREERVDMVVGPEPGPDGECTVRMLFREPFLLVCPARHPLATRAVIQLRNLAGLGMIYPIHSDNTRVSARKAVHRLRSLLSALGMSDTGIQVEHMSTITALVAAGLGVSLIPFMSRDSVKTPEVALVRIARNAMQRELYLSLRSKQSLSIAAASFVALMDRHMPQTAALLGQASA
jgi:DNA-binding transcriptional LysR family regulator